VPHNGTGSGVQGFAGSEVGFWVRSSGFWSSEVGSDVWRFAGCFGLNKAPPADPALAPVPSEILNQFVQQGPISHEELEAAVRRFKKALIEGAVGGELTHLNP
jgi:hypothetical protein